MWLSDHLFFDLAKYGGPGDRFGCYEPIVTLGALAREVDRVRLGTLVMCEALATRVRIGEVTRHRSTASPVAGSTSASARVGTNPSTKRST